MRELSDNDLCHLYKWLHGDTPMGGCYASDEADELIIHVCELVANRTAWSIIKTRIGGTHAAAHIVMSVIDAAGLISHGTSITSSWITQRGEWVRHAYRELEPRGINIYGYGFPHMGEKCPPECELGKLHTT